MVYRPATTRAIAHCVECEEDGLVLRTAGWFALAIAIAVGVLIALPFVACCLPESMLLTLRRLWMATKPGNKLKLVIGFYQIVTKVDEVCAAM